LGGAFGIIAFLISMVTLSRLKVMESTILLLVGQLTAGILFDAFMFKDFSLLKLIGVLLVAGGIIWDNKISASAQEP
ncbi:DMT family transporter, partial [Acinetobacter baumannii]|nr:DMT family transporter [Acinetobacter baumannii]